MTNPVIPSINPANWNTLSGVFNEVLDAFLSQTDDMLPAKVVSYNRATNYATVQPMIQMQATSGEIINRARIASVPVYRSGGGGAALSFNLVAGNLGWIKANDRDISLYLAGGYVPSLPNTKRKHSFSDCIFIPDAQNMVTIAAEDAGNAVFQTTSGNVRIALWPSMVKVTTPSMAIGDTAGYMPNTHAVLDLQSTTRALGLPAMTTVQKNAIASPRAGFVVYDTTESAISVYNGATWS